MAARLTVARIALRRYPRNLLTRWLRQRPLVDRPASIVRRWRTAPSGSSPGSRAAQSAWRRRAPPSSSRHCTAPAVRTAHRQSSASAREGLVSEVCGARARLSTMAELVSAVERGDPNRGAGRRRQEGGDGMCGLSPRGESRRLLVSRPYEGGLGAPDRTNMASAALFRRSMQKRRVGSKRPRSGRAEAGPRVRACGANRRAHMA